jgi:hypothetical protein
LEQVNPYAVMRNTATYEAYRARIRAITGAGQPFSAAAFICFCAWSPLFSVAVGRGMTALAGVAAILAVAGAACGAMALIRMQRYRRDHPIPNEWRQVPRISRPLVPGQRPRLP